MYKNISSIMGSAMVSRFVNIGIAKRISCVLVVVLLVANALNYIDSGLNPCRGLLKNGILLDKEQGVWQPHGCMMHKYKTKYPMDSYSCLQNKKLAFVGDSRMRELMFSFVHAINPDAKTPEGKIHSNVPIKEDKISLSFYWVPELNETATNLLGNWGESSDDRPDIIFQSAGAHTLKKNGSLEDIYEQYTKNFTSILKEMQYLVKEHRTKIFWIMQEPVEESKLIPLRRLITNQRINQYNEAVKGLLTEKDSENRIQVIESFKWISYELIELSEDGLHLPPQALKIESSILLNLLCNNNLHPIDGTCCQSSPNVTAIQIVVFLLGLSCIVGAITMTYLKWRILKHPPPDIELGDVAQNGSVVESAEKLLPNDTKEIAATKKTKENTKFDDTLELIIALSKFTIIMMYFYICDRTNIFMKGNKHFTNARFFLPLLYISLLGLFGIISTSQTALLNRDQTDEWKGWMQLIILIYHMSGASVNVPIYMHIRILVAMYLFMTGYGHFSYFWHKGDYSLYRVLNVVFRINLLTVSLCLVMDRSYQFYYFVPLCTFWFVILYISMTIWPRANIKMQTATTNGTIPEPSSNGPEKDYPLRNFNLRSPYSIMFFKLVMLFLVISVLFVSQSYFEAIFSWWPAIRLFELPTGSVREWWFRCQLDRYAMLHGAVLCFIYIIMKKLSVLDDSKQGCLLSTKASFITMTLSIGIVVTYTVWAAQCTDKFTCNRIHSYASILPITAFIIIRNVPGYLRSGYSAFFAWFGKISLELFIGQYHIWLAADTKGMLVLISPEWPTLNLVITSFIFVCIAHEINLITGILTKHALGSPKDEVMKVLIRLAVFVSSVCAISFINNTFNPPTFGGT
ncbi:N-acetylneuraminate (7)9-O-acetyltransferase-like isoform X2 [Styela clava]